MKRELEIALLEELQGLKDNKQFFLDDSVRESPVARYADPDRFDSEIRAIFRKIPLIAAHSSELPDPGSFLTRELAGLPVLLTRDRGGDIHAFLNVCRHRGARLVNDGNGCRHTFSCPYHAWTWSSRGELRSIPHQEPGFPGLDRAAYGLRRLPAAERQGLVWVAASLDANPDFDGLTGPLEDGFEWCGMAGLGIVRSDRLKRSANWKLLIEGGLECYHFKIAHRDTIGPHFVDNLSSYQMLGPHIRSVLPRASLPSLAGTPREDWSIRDHANVLYTVFPADQFLVMSDHVAWISYWPLAPDLTEMRLVTLAPLEEITPDNDAHWARNHAITMATLAEDFDINEAVQAGLCSGANDHLTFGRYEGALERFNAEVESHDLTQPRTIPAGDRMIACHCPSRP